MWKAPTWLIATSDAWLRFLVAHRTILERHFEAILHPCNRALAICLEKGRFARWCVENGIPTPAGYSVESVERDVDAIRFPSGFCRRDIGRKAL